MRDPSDAIPSGDGIDRRRLLSTLGATGSGAVTGCLSGGDEPAPAETVGTTRTSATATQSQSGRIGDAVFYDPDGDGPYADGQAALDAVPAGGTFVIGHGTWDVAEEGRLLVERSMNVVGMGWTSAVEGSGGTTIVNTGGDAIDEPAVEFNGPESLSENNPRIVGSLRELAIEHEGDAPAVRFKRAIKTTMADCHVSCNNTAPVGVKYEDWAFFARSYRNSVGGATEKCVHVSGDGYAHEFYSNHFATGADGATAFQAEVKRPRLVGGECAVTGDNGTAIALDGCIGAYVSQPGIEATDLSIDVRGGSDQVRLYHVTMGLFDGRTGVRFGDCRGAQLINPINLNHGRGQLAEWTQDAENCGIISDVESVERQSVTDHGATNPYIQITSSVSDGLLSNLPTEVPVSVGLGSDANSPLLYDGSEWRSVPTESYQVG
jgi:hypothetical protein